MASMFLQSMLEASYGAPSNQAGKRHKEATLRAQSHQSLTFHIMPNSAFPLYSMSLPQPDGIGLGSCECYGASLFQEPWTLLSFKTRPSIPTGTAATTSWW
jgi:hypothetical protein